MDNHGFKVVFILGKELYNWQFHTIKLFSKSQVIQNVQFIRYDTINPKISNNSFLFRLYRKFDDILFSYQPNAFKKIEFSELNNPINHFNGELFDINEFFNSISINPNRYPYDLIINLTSIKLSNIIIESAKLGLIQLNGFEDEIENFENVGFWEAIRKIGYTNVSVNLISSNNKLYKLYNGSSITNFKSVSRTTINYFWKVPHLLVREVERLWTDELTYANKQDEINSGKSEFSPETFKIPDNLEMFSVILKMTFRILDVSLKKRFGLEQWILLLSMNTSSRQNNNLSNFQRILPPKDRYWADPFLFSYEGKVYVFFEELFYKDKKGFISVMELDQYGNPSTAQKVIEEKYHLSYPNVFEDDGQIFMIPESCANKNIQLYRCLEFPHKWELHKILLSEIIAVDTTLLKLNGKYWLFTNISNHEGTSTYDELFLYYSDELITDNWISHPLNPIVTDVRNSRPAGKLFWRNNKLYRPAQNCSHHYGYGIQINEILEISETRYKEKIVESILPDWADDLVGTHTINSNDQFVIADALIKR